MEDVHWSRERLREVHLRAAKCHADAALYWEGRGYQALADAEHEKADRELAAAQREFSRRASQGATASG